MRHLVIAFFLGLFLVASPLTARADDAAAAKAYVNNMTDQALAIIKETQAGSLSKSQAKVNFRKILNNSFDIPTIAKFTMGRYWRVATKEEQSQFTSLLQTTILEKYADRLLDFSGDKVTVDNASAINGTDYAVSSTSYPKGESPVTFGWRLRQSGNSFKVIDLSVEGVSMSVTHRSDFASVIERNGGKVSALIDALKNKEFSGTGK